MPDDVPKGEYAMAEVALLSSGTPRTFAVVLAAGDSVMDALVAFAADHDVDAASITAIGAFSRSTLAFFDLEAKQYQEIPVEEQAEVLSLVGDITRDDDGPGSVHAHVVLGLRDGSTRGGHLVNATVRPTLEVMVTDSPAELRRRYRQDVGLALLDLPGSATEGEGEGIDVSRHGLAP